MKSRIVYRFGFSVLGVSAVVNLIVAVRVFFAMQNPVSYNIRVIEPPVFTNVVASLPVLDLPHGAPHGVVTNQALQPPDDFLDFNTNCHEVAVEAYHFMVVDGRSLFRLNGQNYGVGDMTAYGTVDQVYPERVYLRGGGFISNSRRLFDVVDRFPALSPVPSFYGDDRDESPLDTS